MGRMRRQRRYKACDPFAKKTKNVKEPIFDLAPKKKGEDDDHFKESKRFLRFQQGCERAMAAGKRGKQHSNDSAMMDFPSMETKPQNKEKKKKQKKEEEKKAGLERGPNETKKEYFRRLDAQVNDAINSTMMDGRTLRKKRKLHLKARDEKRKKKKMKNDNDDQNPTTNITQETHKFGEYVAAPPELTAKPRNADRTDGTTNTTMTKKKLKGLHLVSLLEGSKKEELNSSSTTTNKQTKELSKEALQKERQRAIDAYRLMKKQNPSR